MEDLYLLVKQYVEDPHKALEVLADALEENPDRYNTVDIVSALRCYQGQQLINLAEKEGIKVHTDIGSVVEFLETLENKSEEN